MPGAEGNILGVMKGNRDGVASLSELQAVFRDRPELCFRHIENCERAPFMRWQAGRMRCIEVESVRGWIFVLFVCEIGKTGLT